MKRKGKNEEIRNSVSNYSNNSNSNNDNNNSASSISSKLSKICKQDKLNTIISSSNNKSNKNIKFVYINNTSSPNTFSYFNNNKNNNYSIYRNNNYNIKMNKNEQDLLTDKFQVSNIFDMQLNQDEEEITVDTLYSECGYTYYQYKTILLTIIIISFEGLQFYMSSALYIPLKLYYLISDNQINLLTSLIYLGFGLGSIFMGVFNKHFNRKTCIIICSLLLTASQYTISLTTNFAFLCVLKFFLGVLLGYLIPVVNNINAEFLPINLRGFILVIVWLGFGFGQIVLILFINFIMPKFEIELVGDLMYKLSYYFLFSTIIISFLLDNSPRNLLLFEKYSEAYFILSEMLERDLTENEKECLKYQYLGAKKHSNKKDKDKETKIKSKKKLSNIMKKQSDEKRRITYKNKSMTNMRKISNDMNNMNDIDYEDFKEEMKADKKLSMSVIKENDKGTDNDNGFNSKNNSLTSNITNNPDIIDNQELNSNELDSIRTLPLNTKKSTSNIDKLNENDDNNSPKQVSSNSSLFSFNDNIKQHLNIIILLCIIGFLQAMNVYGKMIIENLAIDEITHYNQKQSIKSQLLNSHMMKIRKTSSLILYDENLTTNLEYDNNESDQSSELSKYNIENMLIVTFTGMLGIPIGAILAEIEIIGRKRTCLISSFFNIVIVSLLILDNKNVLLYSSLITFFNYMFFNIFGAWGIELLPSSVRDFGIGLSYGFCRIGGILSQFLFMMLFRVDVFVPFYVLFFSFIIIFILVAFLPEDTIGKPLD